MQINETVFNECLTQVTAHYAGMVKSDISEQALNASVQASWDKISKEVSSLYSQVMTMLEFKVHHDIDVSEIIAQQIKNNS